MDQQKSKAFMNRLVCDVASGLAVALALVGDQVGLFKAMAGAGPLTAEQLHDRTGVRLRYLQEWLAGMACAGYLEHDDAAQTWLLPDEHAMFVANPDSEYYLGGLFAATAPLTGMAPRVAEAFKSGKGIAFADYGETNPLVIEHMNRSVYKARLTQVWLPEMPEVVSRLLQGGRALDVGCGAGLVPVLMAQAFTSAQVTGVDVDERSLALARAKALEAGVSERVRFVQASAERFDTEPPGYDLITSFDCLHDLPDPDGALSRMRAALAPGGSVLLVEPRVAGSLRENAANPFARMLYGMSCLHCVPQSIAQGGPALGACWGEAQARRMAREAGFSQFKVLPIKSPAQAFYELRV
jgi:2-polyprenyl-3-methyl-5-hydroxy-6-metoxy-1,4-benzoquinol methylase